MWTAEDIKAAAYANPRLACVMAGLVGKVADWYPTVYTLRFTFQDLTVGKAIDGIWQAIVTGDFLVTGCKANVAMDAFPGSVFGATAALDFNEQSFIDVQTLLNTPFQQPVLNFQFAPIQDIARQLDDASKRWNFIMPSGSSITAQAVLTSAPAASPTVVMTFGGYTMPCNNYGGVTAEKAVTMLIETGWRPDVGRSATAARG